MSQLHCVQEAWRKSDAKKLLCATAEALVKARQIKKVSDVFVEFGVDTMSANRLEQLLTIVSRLEDKFDPSAKCSLALEKLWIKNVEKHEDFHSEQEKIRIQLRRTQTKDDQLRPNRQPYYKSGLKGRQQNF